MKKLPAHGVAFLTLPALSAREAEALIDLLGQLQGALCDIYGDAIARSDGDEHPSDSPAPPSDDNDDSSPF